LSAHLSPDWSQATPTDELKLGITNLEILKHRIMAIVNGATLGEAVPPEDGQLPPGFPNPPPGWDSLLPWPPPGYSLGPRGYVPDPEYNPVAIRSTVHRKIARFIKRTPKKKAKRKS
jgi:hypothetical protein